jgi:hypothetical protein
MYVMPNNVRKACCISLRSKLVLKGFGITPDGLDTSPGALESTEIKKICIQQHPKNLTMKTGVISETPNFTPY